MTERVTAEAVTYKCSVCVEMVRRWFSGGGNAFIIKMIEEYSHLDTSVLMSVFRHYTLDFQSDRLTEMQNKCIFDNYPNDFQKKSLTCQ